MRFHAFGHIHRHHGRHGWGGRIGRHHDRHGEGRGRRFGRFFDHGDLRPVVLALIEMEPRHGYELIKALEERTGGAYRPSPGVVYPTLAMLEDEGRIRQAGGETGRKLFEITDAGRAELDENRTAVEALFARMEDAQRHADPARPRIERAMTNLGLALRARLARPVTPEVLDAIVARIDETATAIEKS